MKRLAIINSDSKEFSYGGVAPIMRNMHKYLCEAFDVQYFYLPDSWKRIPCPGRLKMIIYLVSRWKSLKSCDFILSHIPEGSYVTSFMGKPYSHIYHGNDNPMTQSKYWFGKYFKFVFDIFFNRIEKTCPLKYTVGPVWNDKKKLFNPISHTVQPKPHCERSGFMFAGRLELVKNVDRLIRIYAQLPLNIREKNHFHIAGYGTQENNLRDLVRHLNLGDYVQFLGNLSNENLIEEDSKRKILIMASTQEGLPTAIAEALSVGVPVVSTNPGDIGIVLKNNYNGYIFPLDFQDEDYVKAMLNILNEYDRFAKAALESSKIFNGEVITKGVIDDINNVLDSMHICSHK